MSRIKLPADHIKIEDKLTPVPYKTVIYKDHFGFVFNDASTLSEESYKMLVAVFQIGIMSALAECVNPNAIASFGDAQLKKNYETVLALAVKMGVIETYEAQNNKVEQPSSIEETKKT